MNMRKCSRYEPFTHVKIKNEFLKINQKTTRDNNDSKGWITYHTEKGEFTDKDHKGFYIAE